MTMILHITSLEQWEKAKSIGIYRGDTLDSQGYIHCSTARQIIKVADALYPNQKGLALLCIEAEKVKAKILYEGYGAEESYPHIYGPLNIDAVVKAVRFEPNADGKFRLPKSVADFGE